MNQGKFLILICTKSVTSQFFLSCNALRENTGYYSVSEGILPPCSSMLLILCAIDNEVTYFCDSGWNWLDRIVFTSIREIDGEIADRTIDAEKVFMASQARASIVNYRDIMPNLSNFWPYFLLFMIQSWERRANIQNPSILWLFEFPGGSRNPGDHKLGRQFNFTGGSPPHLLCDLWSGQVTSLGFIFPLKTSCSSQIRDGWPKASGSFPSHRNRNIIHKWVSGSWQIETSVWHWEHRQFS